MSILSHGRGDAEAEGKLPTAGAAESVPAGGPMTGAPAMSSEQLLVAVEVDERGVPRPLDNPTSFKVMRSLGEGGMGVVYLAMQTYPQRMVALKVLKTSGRQASMRRRFAREISALAKLQHRGIAQLLSAGNVQTTLGIQPYLTMEYIEGIPLTDYVVREKLDVEAKLRLFLKVCDAVTHAHRRGIIHRDLSPKNILVTDDGEAHVLDFGLAAMREDAARSGATTVDGQVLGTLNYMSPEQARGSEQDAGRGAGREPDERMDVYALGVILFELLTGSRPILRGHSTLLEALERLANEAPLRASSLDRRFRGDIDTIVQKALERDLARRYATVEALSEDIVRYLKHEPIRAKRPSAAYLTRKFVQRHKVMVSATAAVILALTVGLVLAVQEAHRANRQERETAVKLADAQVSQADALLLMDRREEALDLYNTAWDAYEHLGAPPLAGKLGVWDVDRRNWHKVATLRMFAEGAEVSRYAPTLSPDGLLIAAADGRGHVVVRDVVDWHVMMAADCGMEAAHVSISNDSRLCAVRGRGDRAVIWDIRTGKVVREVAAEGTGIGSRDVAMSGANGYLAMVKGTGNDAYWGSIRGTGPLEMIENMQGPISIAFNGAGELVLASYSGRVATFSPADRTLRETRPGDGRFRARTIVAPDGATAIVTDKTQLTLVDTRTGNAIRNFPMEVADRTSFFGTSHLLTDKSLTPRVYDVEGHFLNSLPGDRQFWSAAGRLAARVTERGEIELWSMADHIGVMEMQVKPVGNCAAAISADGRIAVVTSGKGLSVLDAETGAVLRRLDLTGVAADVRISPDALHVYVCLADGAVDTWDVREGSVRHMAPALKDAIEAAFADGGRFIVWSGGGNADPGAVVVDLQDGSRRDVPGVSEAINGGAISANGKRLAVCTESGELVVHDLTHEASELWRTPVGQNDAQVAPVFAMDDRYVIAGRNAQELCAFDADTGKLANTIVRSGSPLVSLRAVAGASLVLAYDRLNLTVYDLREFRRIRLIETGDDTDGTFAVTPLAHQVLLVNGHGRAVVYDFDHAEDTRAMAKAEATAGAAAARPGVNLAEAFALYRLEPQFTAAMSRPAAGGGSRAQAIAQRQLGLPGAASAGRASSETLAGTRILLSRPAAP